MPPRQINLQGESAISTIVIIGGGGQGGGGNNNNVTVLNDGTIVEESTGATVAKFDTVADAIAYLNHLVVDPQLSADAEDDRA